MSHTNIFTHEIARALLVAYEFLMRGKRVWIIRHFGSPSSIMESIWSSQQPMNDATNTKHRRTCFLLINMNKTADTRVVSGKMGNTAICYLTLLL